MCLVVQAVVRVGRKYAVYLPRRVVEGESIVLRRPLDFFEEARRSPKRLRLALEEFEKTSVEAQEELLGARDAHGAT